LANLITKYNNALKEIKDELETLDIFSKVSITFDEYDKMDTNCLYPICLIIPEFFKMPAYRRNIIDDSEFSLIIKTDGQINPDNTSAWDDVVSLINSVNESLGRLSQNSYFIYSQFTDFSGVTRTDNKQVIKIKLNFKLKISGL